MKHKIGELYVHTPSDFGAITMESDYSIYLQENIENSSCKIPEEYFFMKDEMGNGFENIPNELMTYCLPNFYNFKIYLKSF